MNDNTLYINVSLKNMINGYSNSESYIYTLSLNEFTFNTGISMFNNIYNRQISMYNDKTYSLQYLLNFNEFSKNLSSLKFSILNIKNIYNNLYNKTPFNIKEFILNRLSINKDLKLSENYNNFNSFKEKNSCQLLFHLLLYTDN